MKDSHQLKRRLKELFDSQRLAVLATHRGGQPYGSLVAFAVTDDLKHLLFATTRGTRKYANLSQDGRVAMLVDSRSNQEADFHNAIAATAIGRVEEVKGEEKEGLLRRYLVKHPYLKEFVASPTCAFLKVKVETYYVVSSFQEVMELHVAS